MREKPILFSGPMVQAILDGRKTMTRRVVKPQPDKEISTLIDWYTWIKCPCVHWGDRLWVRETWKCTKYDSMDGDLGYEVEFKDGTRKYFEFDDNERFHQFGKFAFKKGWQSSIYMPKEAARIWLEVMGVRVERLQGITEEDAIKDGFEGFPCDHPIGRYACEDCMNSGWREPPSLEFMETWQSLNDKRGYGWDVNPCVWVVEFKRLEVD